MMFFKKAIILFAILVLAGFAYWYFEIKKANEKVETEESEAYLFEQTDNEIAKITLKEEGQSPIVIEKKLEEKEEADEEEWIILSPVETPGETIAIKSVINVLKESKREEVVWENLDKKGEYGLETPEFSLEFSYKNEDEVYVIDFGIENLDNSKVFTAVSGKNAIFSVPVGLRDSLRKSLFDLRDKRISPYSSDDIEKISLLSLVETFILMKEDDEWYFMPDKIKASKMRVDMYTGNLRWGGFAEVVEEKGMELVKYGLDKPRLFLNFKIKDNKDFMFILGDPITENTTDFYYAMRSSDSMIFQVKSDLVSRLLTTQFELKDRSIFSINSEDIDTVTLEKEGNRYTFAMHDDEWVFSDTGEKLERGYKIDNIIRSITAAEYEERDPIKKGESGYSETGIEDSKYLVAFTFADKRPGLIVRLTEKDEQTNKLWLTPDDGSTVYHTSGYFVSNFPDKREDLL